jgi:hypothetical protein
MGTFMSYGVEMGFNSRSWSLGQKQGLGIGKFSTHQSQKPMKTL